MSDSKRFLGIDYGSRRIGIAVSDPLGIIAQGIGVVINDPGAIDEICEYARKFDVRAVIVGMPLTLKGEKGQSALAVDKFIVKLKESLAVEILSLDERWTSATAHETLLTLGVKKKKRQSKETIDKMAAALILQSYLDSRR